MAGMAEAHAVRPCLLKRPRHKNAYHKTKNTSAINQKNFALINCCITKVESIASRAFSLLAQRVPVISIEEPNNLDHPVTLFALEHGATDDKVAHALSHLEFLSWRVRHPETAERWDPLSLSLSDFIGGDLSPNCWKWEGIFPSSPVIASWLIEQLPHR